MATTNEDIKEEKANWHWRNTMRPVRFFMLDARAAIPFCILLVYFRLHTLIITILITLIFHLLEKKGFTFPTALRALRVWLIGTNRPGLVSFRRRRMRDFG